MRAIFYILTFTIWTNCLAQTETEKKIIARFKSDFLKRDRMFQRDTIHTSSLMLTRERLPNVRRVTTFPNNENIEYVEFYYNDTEILESTYSYTIPDGKLTGITKHYNKNGELEFIQDHDIGTWEVVKFDNYPYYRTLVSMKHIVDSLIISNYGQSFFNEFVKWSPEGSAFYNGKGAGATWYNYQEWEPKEYLLRYSIKLSQEEIYDEQFEVHLDSTGKVFFPFVFDDNKGFEKNNSKNGFVLTKESAISKAREFGLTEKDSSKALTFLSWEFNDDKEMTLFNGKFTYNVAINTKTIFHEPTNGRNRVEYKFEVYVFNPWTGNFIEKQKKKSYKEWEKNSGMTTGLLPDE